MDLKELQQELSELLKIDKNALFAHPYLFQSPIKSHENDRIHSEFIDSLLGFTIEIIEQGLLETAKKSNPEGNVQTWGHSIHSGNQTWVGLSHQTLQTPYTELKMMCDLLSPKPDEHIVDLGAGYGRLGLILKELYPSVKFTGFEYVSERVIEGNRILREWNCTNSLLIEKDLTSESFELPVADYYFLYDYGKVSHIRRTLKQLEGMANKKNFKVIGRGNGVRSLIEIEHPWLSQVFPVHHEEFFSIYSMSF